jgi:hypothetical protein
MEHLLQFTRSSALGDHIKKEHIHGHSLHHRSKNHLFPEDKTAHILEPHGMPAVHPLAFTEEPQLNITGRAYSYTRRGQNDTVSPEAVEEPLMDRRTIKSEECESCHYPPVTNLDGDSRIACIDKETWLADCPPLFLRGDAPSVEKLESDRFNEDIPQGMLSTRLVDMRCAILTPSQAQLRRE